MEDKKKPLSVIGTTEAAVVYGNREELAAEEFYQTHAVLIEAGGRETVVEPKNGSYFTLLELQKLVGGYIEMIKDDKIVIIGHEDERLLPNARVNAKASVIYHGGRFTLEGALSMTPAHYDAIVGKVVVGPPRLLRPNFGDEQGTVKPVGLDGQVVEPVGATACIGAAGAFSGTFSLRPTDQCIKDVKQFRVELDVILQRLKSYNGDVVSGDAYNAEMRLKEAIMWCGMELKRLGEANPYPNSYKPENTTVDPTAQGLKL